MRKLTFFLIAVVIGYQGFTQSADQSTRRNFSTVIDVFNDVYINVPDSVDGRFFNGGMSFSGFFEHHFGSSNFSAAIGAGLGTHNFYSHSFVVTDSNNVSGLRPISKLYPGTSHDKNKLSYTYIDFPIELRMRTKTDFRAAVGFKFGVLIDSHSKYKGDDYIVGTDDDLFVKIKDINNIENLRYGISARFGWRYINVMGFYSFTNLFEKNRGPEMYPISFGISLMPF